MIEQLAMEIIQKTDNFISFKTEPFMYHGNSFPGLWHHDS